MSKSMESAASDHKFRFSLRTMLIAVTVVAVGGFLLMAVISTTSRQAKLTVSRNNLMQIGITLHNYHSALGSFPPQVLLDPAGNPHQGWRGMILPYMESNPPGVPYYDPRLPWNASANRRYANSNVPIYSAGNRATVETSVVAVAGEGFFFNGMHSSKEEHLQRGLSNVIAAIEVVNSGIKWAQPKDWTVADLIARFKAGKVGPHKGGFLALMADGSVQFIEYSRSPDDVLKLFHVADGK